MKRFTYLIYFCIAIFCVSLLFHSCPRATLDKGRLFSSSSQHDNTPHHHGHHQNGTTIKTKTRKVLPSRRPHPPKERDPKEVMARDHHQKSHPDHTSKRGIHKYNLGVLAPILEPYGSSKHNHKTWKDAMVGGGEGRHGRTYTKKQRERQREREHNQRKHNNNNLDEDYYYTYDEESEKRTQTGTSQSTTMAAFLRDTMMTFVVTEDPPHDFLRGSSSTSSKERD